MARHPEPRRRRGTVTHGRERPSHRNPSSQWCSTRARSMPSSLDYRTMDTPPNPASRTESGVCAARDDNQRYGVSAMPRADDSIQTGIVFSDPFTDFADCTSVGYYSRFGSQHHERSTSRPKRTPVAVERVIGRFRSRPSEVAAYCSRVVDDIRSRCCHVPQRVLIAASTLSLWTDW